MLHSPTEADLILMLCLPWVCRAGCQGDLRQALSTQPPENMRTYNPAVRLLQCKCQVADVL